jgi:hypothetical protein
VYGLLGLYWALGGVGFPLGENDPQGELSVLGGLRAEVGAPVITILGWVGAGVAIVMTQTRGRGTLRIVLLSFVWIVAALLTLIVPDYRVLGAVAYLPIFVLGAPFGFPPGANFFDALT